MFINANGKNISSSSGLQFHADKCESLGTPSSAFAWEEPVSLCVPLRWRSQIICSSLHILGVESVETF